MKRITPIALTLLTLLAIVATSDAADSKSVGRIVIRQSDETEGPRCL